MRVAFTSSDGVNIDRHFGQSERFYLWEIGPESAALVSEVNATIEVGDTEDRNTARAALLEGCTLLYTLQVGGPAAAKLVARKVHPLKTKSELPIQAAIGKLQRVLQGRPPPWLRRAMGEVPPEPVDVDDRDDED